MKKQVLTTILLLITIYIFGKISPFSIKTTNQNKPNHRSLSLPFFEDWSSSSFETNNWTTECENWVINNQQGNERPSAEFDWLPQLQNDYSCILTSDFFYGDLLEVGQIMLEFEIRLDDRNSTGDEKLLVEVFDGIEWFKVAEFVNEGNLDWKFNHIDITDYALGNLFQIRFHAVGQNSYDILSWFVDNIEVYRICEAPSELIGQLYWYGEDDWGAELFWNAPEDAVNVEYYWMNWDRNLNGSFGFNPLTSYTVAARWDTEQLTEYVGDTIHSIRLYLRNDQFEHAIIRIWKGVSGEQLLYTDTIFTPIINKWMEYLIDDTVVLDPSEEYRIGYSIVDQIPYSYPVGRDSGPAKIGYGDLIYTDDGGWDSISNYGMDYNFNIQMKLRNSDTSSSNCIGFNIYRMDWYDPYYSFYDFKVINENQLEQSYYDNDFEIGYPTEQCYKVSAVWLNNEDTCESDFALTIGGFDNFICLLPSNVSRTNSDLNFKISPNPTRNNISIDVDNYIEEVFILNLQGQTLHHQKVNNQKQHEIDVSFLQPGIYFIRVKTDKGIGVKKFIKVE